jgi:hypothetical protein
MAAYDDNDPLAIPGPKRSRSAASSADTTIGPPSVARAPISPTLPGPPRVAINPTGTDLAQAGALRPEAGPFSASNPAPLVSPDGRLVTPSAATPAAALPQPTRPNVAAATTPPATAPAVAPPASTAPGATVSGVRVFSDGSGTGAIPATLTRPEIDALQNGNRLSRADAGIGGGIASEAAGGRTLELGAGPLPARPAVDGYARARSDLLGAQRDAASDIASVANRDPRSMLGVAARNIDVERRATGKDGPADKGLQTLYDYASGGPGYAAKLGETGVQDSGATTREGMKNAADLQAERLRASLTKPDTVNLADGTLAIVRPDGTVVNAKDTQGNPVRPQIGKPPVDLNAYGKFVDSATSRFLGADPVTGMITDSQTGKPRQPTAEEYTRATRAGKALADETFSGATGANASSSPSGTTNPTRPTSLDEFKKKAKQYNPNATDAQLDAYYKANYG